MSAPHGGLCTTCRFVRLVPSLRNAIYYRCGRSDEDPAYPRFPRLPVVSCAGYQQRPTDAIGGTPHEDDASADSDAKAEDGNGTVKRQN
jgi:hypothetical protein